MTWAVNVDKPTDSGCRPAGRRPTFGRWLVGTASVRGVGVGHRRAPACRSRLLPLTDLDTRLPGAHRSAAPTGQRRAGIHDMKCQTAASTFTSATGDGGPTCSWAVTKDSSNGWCPSRTA